MHIKGTKVKKSWKHNFEITGDPKGPPNGSIFWWGFEVPDPYMGICGATSFLGPKKSKMAVKAQNQDYL